MYCSYYCSQTGGTSSECSRVVASAAELPFKLNGSSDFFALTHAVCNGAPHDPVRSARVAPAQRTPQRAEEHASAASTATERYSSARGTANPLGRLAVAQR